MAQKLRKHEKNWKKRSVGCDINFTILLSMLKVNIVDTAQKESRFPKGCIFVTCNIVYFCNKQLQKYKPTESSKCL